MCDVCKAEGSDWQFRNGMERPLSRSKLYGVYEGRVAQLSLCLIHDIELFMTGEKKFLVKHPKLAMNLLEQKEKFAS